jgi:hypothetical protein
MNSLEIFVEAMTWLLLFWVLSHTGTVKVIWPLWDFTGDSTPEMSLRTLFPAPEWDHGPLGLHRSAR